MSNNLYSCFVFKPIEALKIGQLHLTHTFLGAVSQDTQDEAAYMIDLYFRWKKPILCLCWEFQYVDFFADASDDSVVLRNDFSEFTLLTDLRIELSILLPGAGNKLFEPHVTIVRNGVRRFQNPIRLPLKLELSFFGLFRGDKCVGSWPPP